MTNIRIYDQVTGGTITNQIAYFPDGVLSFTFKNLGETATAEVMWHDGTVSTLYSTGDILSREVLVNGIESFSVNAIGTVVEFAITGLPKTAITYSVPPTITLTFDDITNADALVGDSSDFADWNTWFDLPAKGIAFTSVSIVGNVVTLRGGSFITLTDSLFGDSGYGDHLLSFVDTGCVVTAGYDAFGDAVGVGCINMTHIQLSSAATIDDDCFSGNAKLVSIILPAVTEMGSTTGDNNVFHGISGKVIALTIPTAMATDTDITLLIAANTVTVNLV